MMQPEGPCKQGRKGCRGARQAAVRCMNWKALRWKLKVMYERVLLKGAESCDALCRLEALCCRYAVLCIG